MLLFVGVLMGALDLSMVGPVIPAIEKSMNIHGRSLSWIFSIYLLLYLFGIPLMSKLSDVYGRRIIYILCLVIFGMGATIVALSDNLTTLLTGRAIQGFGSSGIFPVAAATIGDLFPVTKRGKALGLLGAVFGIAFILGPIIAGSMLHFFRWNAIFLINLPIVLVLIIFSIWLLPGKPVINQKDPVLTAEFLRSNQLRLVGLIALGLGMFQSSIVFLPKLAVELFQVSPSKASFMLLPLVLSTAFIPPVSGLLLNKIGSRTIVLSGLIFAVVSLFLFSLLANNMLLFYAAEAGLGVGLAIRPSLKYIVLNEIGANFRASAVGMLIVFISIGQIAGASLIGVIISESKSSSDGFFYSFVLLGFVTAIVAFLSFFLKKKSKEIPMRQF
jgi:MFS family permease